jgi:hypothetical protein
MTNQYWAHALDRKGRTIGQIGPVESRDKAREAIRTAYPLSHSFSVGYGAQGCHLDIRNERNLPPCYSR